MSKRTKPGRRGAILVMALVTLLVVGLIAGLIVQRFLNTQRQMRREAQQLQAEWLAESAVTRGWLLLQANADYTGEEWQAAGGVATIRVEQPAAPPRNALPSDDGASTVQITVQARYPDHASERALIERTYLLPLAPAGPAANP
jgi:Tfp pilus assembly protein PilX